MALIICPECNDARMSDNAAQCPKCGCSMDVIRKMIAEKESLYQDEKNAIENQMYERAEYEWDCYVGAIAEAADKYNSKYAEIEAKYQPQIENAEKELRALDDKTKKSLEDVTALEKKIKSLGLFKSKERKVLSAEVINIQTAITSEKNSLEKKINELKEKCISEIDEIADVLMSERNKQAERIENEVQDLKIGHCASASDIVEQMIDDEVFKILQIRHMLEIKGAMTTAEIKEQMPFADAEDIGVRRAATSDIDKLLADKKFLTTMGIGEKQIIDDFYLVALTDSAKDKIRQDEITAIDVRLAELAERRRQLAMQQYNSIIMPKPASNSKQASVIKRGIAGAVIAGPAGALLGGMSAINKNMVDAHNTSREVK